MEEQVIPNIGTTKAYIAETVSRVFISTLDRDG